MNLEREAHTQWGRNLIVAALDWTPTDTPLKKTRGNVCLPAGMQFFFYSPAFPLRIFLPDSLVNGINVVVDIV